MYYKTNHLVAQYELIITLYRQFIFSSLPLCHPIISVLLLKNCNYNYVNIKLDDN